ncbi:hypothetical protein BKA70DRAFT_313918 [Coprinopsis sp. MPI-PUGE-AT-0042]|nr:hypothetical protein BKA70DRAFT_313918 [Coprinopsis sp. MPI-PUGE-AT-0042]
MSAAASVHELESPRYEKDGQLDAKTIAHEREVVEELVHPIPGPIIAVDMDDVLSQTNLAVAEWHNDVYGTNMKVDDFLYYYYWKNPYWGTLEETFAKVREFYKTDRIHNTIPVPGAAEGIQNLKSLGFRLVVVTARTEDTADESWGWIQRHFPDCFESIICTGQFKDAQKKGHEVLTRLSKADVCDDLKAVLLIDDSSENALQCTTAERPTPVLLFGNYEWNKRVCQSGSGDKLNQMSFDARLEHEGGREFWKDETVPIPEGAPLWRVNGWVDACTWIKQRIVDGKFTI